MQEAPPNLTAASAVAAGATGNTSRRIARAGQSGNREKFVSQAMATFEAPLISYASTIVHDLDRARDLVEETFTRLGQQDISRVEDSLKVWLFTTCRNRALEALRKEKPPEPPEDMRWKKVAGPNHQPDDEAAHQEKKGRLLGYIGRLSANQREVIILKFQQEFNYPDIRRITGLTTANIGFLTHTGLRRLRDILPDDLRL